MTSTEFWFASDAEYYAATEDCAVVGKPASWVKGSLHDHGLDYEDLNEVYDDLDDDDGVWDDDPQGFSKESESALSDALTRMYRYANAMGLERDKHLLYADVTDEDHVEISKRVAKAGFLEEENNKSKEAREKLIDHLADPQYHIPACNNLDSDDEETDEEADVPEARRKCARTNLEHAYGRLSARIVEYIISIQDGDERREVLNIYSNQHLRKLQRPVVLLVGMLEKPPADSPNSRKEGWAIGYDFYKNIVVVKPFLFDKNHHPLAEKWDMDHPNDGICMNGSPTAAIGKIMQLKEDIHSKAHEKDPLTYTHKILVYYLLGAWLLRHWKALASGKQEYDGAAPALTIGGHKFEELSEARGLMLTAAREMENPYAKTQPAPEKILEGFKYLQSELEHHEMSIRREAVRAKEAGNETAAKNAAKLYGQLLEQLQAFNMNPEKEL
ncbi:MAG: hypothetical protein Q9170_006525 [Blastenia crenularia]